MKLLPLLALLLTIPAFALDLYVSPTGKDSNSGSKSAPFQTLEKARDTIRALKPLPAGGVTVWLWPGLYHREATFELTKDDTGTPEAPIVYRAVKPGASRLMGGMMLPASAFKPVTDPRFLSRLDPAVRDQVLQASLKDCGVPEPGPEWASRFAGAPISSELFFDRQRMTLARWPNHGEWTRIVDVTGGAPHRIQGVPGDKIGKFTYSGDRPTRWLTEPDLWLHGYWFWDWSDQRQKVDSIDTASKTINLTPPYHGYGYRKNARYYAMNALCELDTPGEWYIDRDSWTLFFLPPAPLANHEIALSLLTDPLVKLTDVSNVTFRDLTFEVSRGEGVQIFKGDHDLVAGCTLRNLARLAVRVEGGTNHGVQSCDMYSLGVGGISLSGGDRKTLTPAGHYADNNHIHHFAQLVFAYQNAIRLNGVGCRMTHNLVHDTIHEALAYSGNDQLVEFNEVYNVCLEADDSGVIHQGRDWTWRGNTIRYNFFHDIMSGPACSNNGVYLDDMECGVTVYGNVLYRIPRAILVGGGRDDIVTNNLIIDSPMPVSIDNRAMNWASYHVGTTMKGLLDQMPYQQEPWRSKYPALVNIWEDDPGVPKHDTFASNVMVRCGKPEFAPEVIKYGTVGDNLALDTDPGFADPARLDFSLKPDAALYKQLPSFKPIPFKQIGVYLDEYRKVLPVRTPVLNPASQAFVDEMALTLTVPGSAPATIRYTLDGSEPTSKSPIYKQPLRLTDTVIVKAAAFPDPKSDEGRSGVAFGTYPAMHLGAGGGVYLSDLEGTDIFAYGNAVHRDASWSGSAPLSISGQKFEKGLILHPQMTDKGGVGHVTYDLTGGLAKARILHAMLGIEDETNPGASVTFAVEVFRGGKWEQVFASGILRKGDPAQAIDVPIAGAEKLRLSVTDAGDGINSDHAAWADAKLQ